MDNQIKRTYSFHYIEGFRPLLVSLIGTKECEKIEQKLLHTPASKFDAFKNCLSNLKSHRNTHAHTHLNNTTPQILSPSSLRTQRKLIGDALLEIENELRALGY
ncbi:hypothetical protein [Undibacterium sp. WLHG33]|uniref:hypothetical protein n=1 Tax=Undibacterium sp. WLHG33 TaxID=3412482 RepID=UPI003C306F16